MSGAGHASDGGPAGGAPPDLFGDAPGWDAPLPDLANEADGDEPVRGSAGGAPQDRQRDTGPGAGGVPAGDPALSDLMGSAPDGALPDLGGADPGTEDLWAPAPRRVVDEDGGGAGDALADLSRRPRSGRRGRARRRGAGGGAAADDAGRVGDGPAAAGSARAGRSDGDRGTGPVAEALAAAREGESSSGPGEPAKGADDGASALRGLAIGGPIGGLEPGTLFGTPEAGGPRAAEPGGRKRRRGRRRGGEDAPEGGESATEPERPLTAEERLQHALKLSYQHLTKRDRTISEVRAHLEKREIDEASVTGALAELVEFGYLDDERYAARFVEDKRRLEGWGHLRIEQGLRRTGVDREIADRAVAADPLRGDEADLAVETLEQRLGGRAPEDDRGRQKALRLLATKGYPLDTAYAAVRTYERRCAERADD